MKRLVIYTVQGLVDKLGGVDIRLRVVSISEIRLVKTRDGQEHNVVDIVVGDRTGLIRLSLWDEKIREVEAGDVIDMKNAYVNRFKGLLRLNIGMFGILEKVSDTNFVSIEELSKVRRRRYT
ncbi:hypothetical protein MUP77_22150, partial [Candidatus Bathyarchaeota archaeon]|nr:hypothetical protein [Candidatus Bathyarchaeota archaeon]